MLKGLQQEQVVRLQPQSSDTNGSAEINRTHLIQQAGHLHAEHILVGDLEGDEIPEVIRTWIPWLATMRAYSVEDALSKLDNVTRLTRGDDPIIPLRIAQAVDLVVHLENLPTGHRRVARISEVQYTDGNLTVHDIYAMEIFKDLSTKSRFVNRPIGEETKRLFDKLEISD